MFLISSLAGAAIPSDIATANWASIKAWYDRDDATAPKVAEMVHGQVGEAFDGRCFGADQSPARNGLLAVMQPPKSEARFYIAAQKDEPADYFDDRLGINPLPERALAEMQAYHTLRNEESDEDAWTSVQDSTDVHYSVKKLEKYYVTHSWSTGHQEGGTYCVFFKPVSINNEFEGVEALFLQDKHTIANVAETLFPTTANTFSSLVQCYGAADPREMLNGRVTMTRDASATHVVLSVGQRAYQGDMTMAESDRTLVARDAKTGSQIEIRHLMRLMAEGKPEDNGDNPDGSYEGFRVRTADQTQLVCQTWWEAPRPIQPHTVDEPSPTPHHEMGKTERFYRHHKFYYPYPYLRGIKHPHK